jgi:hypothetical protein
VREIAATQWLKHAGHITSARDFVNPGEGDLIKGSAQIGVKISFKGRQPNKQSVAKPLCRYVSPATALHTKRNVITLRIPSMKWSRYSENSPLKSLQECIY